MEGLDTYELPMRNEEGEGSQEPVAQLSPIFRCAASARSEALLRR